MLCWRPEAADQYFEHGCERRLQLPQQLQAALGTRLESGVEEHMGERQGRSCDDHALVISNRVIRGDCVVEGAVEVARALADGHQVLHHVEQGVAGHAAVAVDVPDQMLQ